MYKFRMAVLLVFFSSNFAFSADDVKKEIIERCKTQMGSYRAAMVKACVDQDIEAENTLNQY